MIESRRITLQVGQNKLNMAGIDLTIFARQWAPVDPIGTVVCFHGYTDNSSDFTYFGEVAAQKGYKVVCPDWPGRGRSSWLSPDQYDLNLFRSVMAAVIERAKPPVTLLASSWSTFIALPYLATSRKPPASAILVDAILTSGPSFEYVVQILSSEASREFRDQEALRVYLAATRPSVGILSIDEQTRYTRRRTSYVKGVIRVDYDPIISANMASLKNRRIDLTDLVLKTRVPTMLVYGRDSIFRDQKNFEKLMAHGPLLTLREDFPGGHPPLINDYWQVQTILDYMSSVGA